MAFSEFCCRSGGNNLYAGTLNGGSTLVSATPLVTYTNGANNSTTHIFTPASGNPITDGVLVGMFISLYTDGGSPPSATSFIGRISAVTATTITCASIRVGTEPNGSNITCVVGGAWSGPSGSNTFPFTLPLLYNATNVATNQVKLNFKNDQTYNMTVNVNSTYLNFALEGFSNSYGDGGKAVFDGGTTGASYTLFSVNTANSNCSLRSFIFQNNGLTGNAGLVGIASTGRCVVENCVFCNSRGLGLSAASSTVVNCEAYNNNLSNTLSQAGFVGSVSNFIQCYSHDNPGSNGNGFIGTATLRLIDCIADNNGGSGAISSGNGSIFVKNCSIYGNTTGITVVQSSSGMLLNNIISNNTTGILNLVNGVIVSRNNAFYSNTADTSYLATTATYISGSIALSASPFINAASGDFTLNNTSGGGLSCKATGYYKLLQVDPSYSSPTPNATPDIGAKQIQYNDIHYTRVYTCSIYGNGYKTSFTIPHNLNDSAVTVAVVRASAPNIGSAVTNTVYTRLANSLAIKFSSTPPSGDIYTVTITRTAI